MMPLTRQQLTHRIGRFYTGRPSWRTRLRSLRRRLGNASLPLSEEEHLIKVKQQLLAENRSAGDCEDTIHALRLVWRLPRVMLAADGQTTFRYVKALKNASTTILNLLLEMSGEAAWHSWDEGGYQKKHLRPPIPLRRVQIPGQKGRASVSINDYHSRFHDFYMRAKLFAREPYADIRFCVVRDPVERFVSALTQIQLMSLHEARALPRLTSASIDAWLDRMTDFYSVAGGGESVQDEREGMSALDPHLLRQIFFLGCDAGYYTHIFSTRRPQEFHEFLSDLAGKPLSTFAINSLARRQKILRAQGMSLEQPHLTPAQRRRVEGIYAEDYRVFGRWF